MVEMLNKEIFIGKHEWRRPRRRPRYENGSIILKWIFGEVVLQGVDMTDGWGYGPLACCCEHGTEPMGYVKGGEFLD
jgi:hypothetical protein